MARFWIPLALICVLLGSCFQSNANETILAPRAAGFTTEAPLPIGRSQHTATLLNDGRVLVAGGVGDGNVLFTTALVYDPVGNTWSGAGTLSFGRYQHTATLLPNGTVLLIGGMGLNGSLASAEIYDPVANAWTTTGSMTQARQSHTATILPNGKVLVAGGAKFSSVGAGLAAIASCEIFDPSSNAWTSAADLSQARYLHTAALLQNNKVVVASGATSQTTTAFTTTATAELYDYISNTWASAGKPVAGRAHATLVPITFQRFVTEGGQNGSVPLPSAELYDSQVNTWTSTGALIQARTLHTATVLNSGQVLVTGGFDGNSVLNSAELYDPVIGGWNSAGTLNTARQFHTATLLQDGRVLIVGGVNQIAISSAEIYDTGATGGPLTLASTPTASPNPANVGQIVTFSAAATGGTGALTYTWTFGDGASGSGSSVTHAYSAEGTYSASITVTDATNTSVSGSTSAVISGSEQRVLVGIGADDDGDGFSNVVEQTLGSNPNDPNSVPLGVTNVATPLPLTVAQLRTKLVFNRGNRDSIFVAGALPIPAGFVAAGSKIGIDINGVPYLAVLNTQARSGTVFALQFRKSNGVVPAQLAFFVIRLKYGTYSPALAEVGMTNGDFKKKSVAVAVSILFNKKLYQASKPQLYSARLDHFGTSH